MACKEDPPVPADSSYSGVTTRGESIRYDLFRDTSTLKSSMGDESTGPETVYEPHEDIELDSVLTAIDDPTRYAIEIEDVGLITNFTTLSGESTLGIGLSSAEADGYGAYTTARMVEGDYLWLSMEECGAGDMNWGFATFGEDSYATKRRGPPSTLADVDVFEGTISAEEADETGAWSLVDNQPGSFLLEHGGITEPGWLLPGRALLIQRGSGFWFAISNPASHLSVLNASGIYKFMDIRCADGALDSWGVGNFSIYDREVEYLRYASNGAVENVSGDMDWHENVGSGFGLLFPPQDEEAPEFDRLYFSIVEDLALVFQHGNQPSIGLAMRVGLAGF